MKLYPIWYYFKKYTYICTRKDIQGYESNRFITNRKGITQAKRPHTGERCRVCRRRLKFIRELEQGKPTVRMDKVNQLLALFNYELVAMPIKRASAA